MTESKKAKRSRKKYIYAVGRRKTATAQVRLFRGKGQTEVNGQAIGRYFPGEIAAVSYSQPFQVTKAQNKYFATILVKGSGKSAQLAAVVHGLARALDKADPESYHDVLKKHQLLTRDSRRRERRKPGQMGRARKKKQSPKR